MGEKKRAARALQPQLPRPATVRLVVAEHDVQRFAQLLELSQGRRFADVAQVPDFVGVLEPRRQLRRITVVGVRDDGDAHHLAVTVPASGT